MSYAKADTTVGDFKAGYPFDDTKYIPNGSTVTGIKSISVRHGWYIDALDIVYLLSDGNQNSTGHGGWGDDPSKLDTTNITLEKGEEILKIEGRGGPGKHVGLLRFSIGKAGKISRTVPDNGYLGTESQAGGENFSVDGPVLVFSGTADKYIEALEFWVKK